MIKNRIGEQAEKVVATQRADFLSRYHEIFTQMTSEWKKFGDKDNKMWLQYSASYLFRTNGIGWAMDLCIPTSLCGCQLPENLANNLKDLVFVLFTHTSRDHIDIQTVKALAHLPIRWVVPDHMTMYFKTAGVPMNRIIEIKFGEDIEVEGINIHAFESVHWHTPQNKHPVETGYLIKTGNLRLLFPGDIRTYDSSLFPKFGPVDWIFAHLWLGSDQALSFPPPLLDDFCEFILDFKPRSVLLSHLHEIMREPNSYWSYIHAGMVIDQINIKNPKVKIAVPKFGEGILL